MKKGRGRKEKSGGRGRGRKAREKRMREREDWTSRTGEGGLRWERKENEKRKFQAAEEVRGHRLQTAEMFPWYRADRGVPPASSASQWGRKENGANQANFHRLLTISIHSPKNAAWSASRPQNDSLAASQFTDARKNQGNREQGHPQSSQSLSVSQKGFLFCKG